MKKLAKSLLCLTLALTLVLSFTACGKKDRSEEAIQLVKDFRGEKADSFESAAAFCVDPDAYLDYVEEDFKDFLELADMELEDIKSLDDLKECMIEASVSQGTPEEYAEALVDAMFDMVDASFTEGEYSVEKDDDKYIVTLEGEQYDNDSAEDILADAESKANQYAKENGITSASDPAFIKAFEDAVEDAIDDLEIKSFKSTYVVVEVDGELKIDWDECDLDD